MKRRNTLIASAVAVVTVGVSGALVFSSGYHASASPTVLGKLQKLSHTHAEDVAVSKMSWKIDTLSQAPKVPIETILSKMESIQYPEAINATSIEAVPAVVSGIPAIMVNPQYISDDPQIQVNGDYLDNVPVWVVTFNGVRPPVHAPKGITVKGVPNSHTELFDANTGDLLLGFSGN